MNFYAAGWQSGTLEREKRLLAAGVFKHRCFSFANLLPIPGLPWHLSGVEAGYKLSLKNGIGIMLDSGVFSLRTYRKYLESHGRSVDTMPTNEEFVRLYVDFVKRYEKKLDFAVTVDFVKSSAPNFKEHVKLEKLGIRTVPVYHGDAGFEYLRRYADRGYRYICIGSSRALRTGTTSMRRYLDGVFELGVRLNLEFHGLAQTSPWVMLDYPWRSIDSSSWARVAGFGSILGWDERTHRLSTLHVSVRTAGSAKLHGNAKALQSIKRHVEAEGYDFEMLRTDTIYRHQYNAATMLRLAAYAEHRHRVSWRALV